MTVIAAVWDEAKRETCIGSDTLACNDDTRMICGPKWTVHGPWAAGVAGDRRTQNLIAAFADRLFTHLDGAFQFTERLGQVMRDDNYSTDSDPGPRSWGQNVILAHPGGVWSLCPSLSIVEIPSGVLWADGSGRAYALGAGHVAKGSPKARLSAAIGAAIHWCSSCGGEVWLHQLKG